MILKKIFKKNWCHGKYSVVNCRGVTEMPILNSIISNVRNWYFTFEAIVLWKYMTDIWCLRLWVYMFILHHHPGFKVIFSPGPGGPSACHYQPTKPGNNPFIWIRCFEAAKHLKHTGQEVPWPGLRVMFYFIHRGSGLQTHD